MRGERSTGRRVALAIGVLTTAFALATVAPPAGAATKSHHAAAKAESSEPAASASRLAKVQTGMTPEEVRKLLGEPTGERTYPTGKAFIPFYYGSDTHRTDWKYKGVGRVVFGHNRYSGNMKVIRVDTDPSETGH
jgi:outer membrane protein assembly factor BamE (lipoprotein component of BamABCDE complex)